ncbi:beta-1-4-mannosyltransferase egh-like [Brachionus plicatilis]|uniref:Beta-1-4-mannosyltransferase egh-like n=1 Tax=Brachionus plicatilis TaxID=10195 RepID=A0A3M7RB60_BRAPC|nr:beta-1-4-mannosyltransferase egh-like [Brachionus plicatilis]
MSTKGDQPELLQKNVFNNIYTCLKLGFDKFQIEITSNRPIMPSSPYIREKVAHSKNMNSTIPKTDSNLSDFIDDESWILLMNEDFILTEQVLCDIVNFSMIDKNCFAIGTVTTDQVEPSFENISALYTIGRYLIFRHFYAKFPHLLSPQYTFILCKNTLYRKILFKQKECSSLADKRCIVNLVTNEGHSMEWINGQMISPSPELNGNPIIPEYINILPNSHHLKNKIMIFIIYFCFKIFEYSFFTFLFSSEKQLEMVSNFVASINGCLYLIGSLSSYRYVGINLIKKDLISGLYRNWCDCKELPQPYGLTRLARVAVIFTTFTNNINDQLFDILN